MCERPLTIPKGNSLRSSPRAAVGDMDQTASCITLLREPRIHPSPYGEYPIRVGSPRERWTRCENKRAGTNPPVLASLE